MNRMTKLLARSTLGAMLLGATLAHAQPAQQWDFNNGDLSATVGTELIYTEGPGGHTQLNTKFGTTTSFGIPDIGGQPAKVMMFPKTVVGGGYFMPTPNAANGTAGGIPGTLVNKWTLVMDILFPATSDATWRAIIDVDITQALDEDSEFFVNPSNGIGIAGVYDGAVLPNTWYRMAVVVDAETGNMRKYLNGNLVGSQTGIPFEGRFSMGPASFAELFSDNDEETNAGYVNSIQVYGDALSNGQIAALGAATADGLPTTIPAVPSNLEYFIPSGTLALGNSPLGIHIKTNDATLDTGSVVVKLDGTPLTGVNVVALNGFTTISKSGGTPLAVGTKHTLEISYNEVVGGATRTRTFTTQFEVALFVEDFDSLVLGPNVEEGLANEKAFTRVPPAGWVIDDSQMPGFNEPDYAARNGVTDFSGWSFMDAKWWIQTAGDQNRSQFTKAKGTLAVADPDEWDDGNGGGHYQGLFNAFMTTSEINVAGLSGSATILRFDSSWRPEAQDDGPPNFPEGNINNQTGVVYASYDGGERVQILRFESVASSPFFHADDIYVNETVILPISVPAGAQKMKITFGMLEAANDWWWAVDNLAITVGAVAPNISTEPLGFAKLVGSSGSLSVVASGTSLQYQWQKGGENIPNANSPTLTFTSLKPSDAGVYRCVVSNTAGTDTSLEVTVSVLQIPSSAGSLRTGLAAYYPFDTDFSDLSGNSLHGTPVGAPAIEAAGKVGRGALKVSNTAAESSFNFVTLGNNSALPFGQADNFTVSFWVKTERVSGDPALLGTKDWDSGGNTGWIIGTQGDGRIEWNYKRSTVARKDLDYTSRGNILNTGGWAHVTVVWNINGNADTYYNGELVDSRSIAPGDGSMTDPALSFNLGQDGAGNYGSDWAGWLDDVAIWSRALTGAEVLTVYSYGNFGDSFVTSPELNAGLGTHLKLDGNYADASGAGNNGTAVGSPAFGPGKVGQAARLNTDKPNNVFNYVTLGNNTPVRFGETTDFSVSFWAKLNLIAGDPAFIANKNWGSGGNTGWVIATDGDTRLQWNYRRNFVGSTRKDFDSVGGIFGDLGWHHVVVVFQINGDAITYVDGNEFAVDRGNAAARKAIGPGTGTLLDPALRLNIGQDGTGAYSDVDVSDMWMDEVAIWNRAISGREVAVAYSRGQAGTSLDGTTPVTAPSIVFSMANGQLSLSWVGEGFVLQENSDVANAAGWTAVAGVTGNAATITVSGGGKYYRLKK